MKRIIFGFAALAAFGSATAGEAYAGIGFPGVTVGYAHPLPNGLQLRGEYTFGISANKNGQHGAANYTGNIKTNTGAALVDWFPYNNGFRVTGGLALNDVKLALASTGGFTLGGVSYLAGSGAYLNADVKFPTATPYLGIGYSQLAKDAKGWGLQASIGLLVGKFDVNVKTNLLDNNGNSTALGSGVTKAQIDAEARKIRDSLGSISALPTASIGASYRF
jgi:hypothetical protein